MQINYRIACLEDLEKICAMVKSAIDAMTKRNIFQWDELYPDEEIFREDIGKKQLRVGMTGEQIAVIYVLNQEYDEEYKNGNWKDKNEPFFVVHRLCVNPVFQNRGIGKITMEHIECELLSLDIKAVRLDVFSGNPYALKLYDGFGYENVGCAEWRKGKFYLMEKYL